MHGCAEIAFSGITTEPGLVSFVCHRRRLPSSLLKSVSESQMLCLGAVVPDSFILIKAWQKLLKMISQRAAMNPAVIK